MDLFDLTPKNLFETDVGNFWYLLGSRGYCRDRRSLAMLLHQCGQFNNSRLAIELALEHFYDLIQLCGDNVMNMYPYIPCMLVGLGQFQEAYNFLHWWYIVDGLDLMLGDHSFVDLVTFSCFKDKDMFEELDKMNLTFRSTSELLSLFCLKFSLMNSIAQNEVTNDLDRFEAFLMGTDSLSGKDSPVFSLNGCWPVITKIKEYIMSPSSSKVSKLKGQLWELLRNIDQSDGCVIPGFLNIYGIYKKHSVEVLFRGSDDEEFNLLDFHFMYWYKTAGLFDHLLEMYKELQGESQAILKIELVGSISEKVFLDKKVTNIEC